MESPLRLTAHGGFGEGNEETRPSRGGKVRFVSTLPRGAVGNTGQAVRWPPTLQYGQGFLRASQTLQLGAALSVGGV
jgi:hypothetical protein